MADSNCTLTYPRDQRGYQSGPDLVTALGVFGRGVALAMLAGQDSFTLGRAEHCDLRVDNKYAAHVNARIERIVNSRASLRITNVSSGKNDIVYNSEIAESGFEMGQGNGSRLATRDTTRSTRRCASRDPRSWRLLGYGNTMQSMTS